MIGLILKNWKFVLDILLLLLILVAVFLWNPLGIFGGKIKLENTANMVAEVKKIGQLVTAEYYGEVIASMDEARLNLIEDLNIQEDAFFLWEDIQAALLSLYSFQSRPLAERVAEYRTVEQFSGWRKIYRRDVLRNNIVEKLNYHDFLDDLEMDPLYDPLLEYVWREKSGKQRNEKWNPSNRNKEEALFFLYQDIQKTPKDTLNRKAFMDFYYQNISSSLSRKESRKKLAMIGRGWVKAGFDFSQLDASSVSVYEDIGEVHILGLSPKILDNDINPWFIPEKGVPGFEILDDNGQVDFDDIKLVKLYCLEKLLVHAKRADILNNAERQGEETLKNLFSLITGKEIKRVIFYNDEFIQFARQIEEDGIVSYFEAVQLDSLMRREIRMVDSLQITRRSSTNNQLKAEQRGKNIAIIIQKLKNLNFQEIKGNFGYFSKIMLEIASDGILDSADKALLERLRMAWKPGDKINDSIAKKENYPLYFWFENPGEYMKEFNNGISYLMQKGLVEGEFGVQTKMPGDLDSVFMKDNWVLNYNYMGDSVEVVVVENARSSDSFLKEQLYPFIYEGSIVEGFVQNKTVKEKELHPTKNQALTYDRDSVWLIGRGSDPFIKRVQSDFIRLIPPEFQKILQEKEHLHLGKTLTLILETDDLSKVFNDGGQDFSSKQDLELDTYFSRMVMAHEEQKNKGALERANDWVVQKLENRKQTPAWLTEIRSKIGR